MNKFVAVMWAGVFVAMTVMAQGSGARSTTLATLSPYGEAPALPNKLPARPRAGTIEIMKSSEVKPGMKGIAWTVFQGTQPEAVPVEIIGPWKNAWGPAQDVILAKLGGKAAKTNVAGGMSGSPVYIDGKLVGAIALRISVFSPDAICGITPIEHMLEINAIDETRPSNSKAPQQGVQRAEGPAPGQGMSEAARMKPIDTPLMLSGFHEATLQEFRPFFEQMGVTAVQGGAAGSLSSATPAEGWQSSLQPGEAIAGVLMSGDMSVTGLGTVTYNDGKRVLGFGHSFFNLGPVSMPMAKGEVLMVLSSQFQPNKFANATEVVGALRQDRHSGIMGELGAAADTIPVTLKVKTQSIPGAPVAEKTYHFNVFVHQKWTPFLMMMTTFNTLQDMNAAASDEATYRLSGRVKFDGLPDMKVSTMAATGEGPVPAPMQIASWWADKFNRLFQNPKEMPKVKSVDAELVMSAERKVAAVDSAWLDHSEVSPGGELTGKVMLRQWRGDEVAREFKVKVPASLPKGEHRLMLSDAASLNRGQAMAGSSQHLDLAQAVSLANQERPNDRLYISLVQSRPTVYAGDGALREVPSSVLNVMQSARTGRPVTATSDTAQTVDTIVMDQVVSGNTSLRFTVR